MTDAELHRRGSHATPLPLESTQQLLAEHRAIDEELRALAGQAYLTSDEQLRESALKKQKLAVKDRLELARRPSAASE